MQYSLEQKFRELYLCGKTVAKAAIELNIPTWRGYELKAKLGLLVEHWQRVGMPTVFSEYSRVIIFGTLLGDASLSISGKCKYNKLYISHSPKQNDYIKWIHDQLLELKPSEVGLSGDKWGTLRFYTPPHPEFDNIYKICYPDGVKQVTREWLEQLSPLSLAVWYMDDGGRSDCSYNLATCAFSLRSCELLCDFMKKKWNCEATIRNTDYPRLNFNKENSLKLRSLIESFIIPSMSYKLEFKPYDPVTRKQTYLRKKQRSERSTQMGVAIQNLSA